MCPGQDTARDYTAIGALIVMVVGALVVTKLRKPGDGVDGRQIGEMLSENCLLALGVTGVIAVPIMIVMMLLAGRRDIMGEHTVSGRLRLLGWFSTAVMAAAVIGMLVTS